MTHPIPFAALDGKVGIMGVTGTGKTFTAIGLTEQLLEAGRQVIVIDPTGVYNGLRTVFPIPIFGGHFGDVEIGEDSGQAVARLIIDRDLSAIIDVSHLLKRSHASARRFMRGFVAELKTAPARARYIVMDEADEFMPENAGDGVAQLFGDLKWIVRRGRSEGWRMMMVTQRPQDIAKSVLSQCETMVIHRLTSPQDRKALVEWVKGNADSDQAKAVLDSMARLDTGEAWVWSPGHDLLQRVQMPLNRSEDRSRTPDADDAPRAAQGFKPVDLEGIRAALVKPLSDLPAMDKSEISLKPSDPAPQAEMIKLRRELVAMTADRDYWKARAETRMVLIERARAALQANGDEVEPDGTGVEGKPPVHSRSKEPLRPAIRKDGPQATLQSGSDVRPAPTRITPSGSTPSRAALAIADLLDKVNPAKLSWVQAATMTGRKASGGNFNAARKWLRESGRIVEEGDLIWSADPAPTGMARAEALSLWSSVLSNPAPRMIVALSNGPLTKEGLGEAIGAAPRGGNFNNGLAQLRRNGVVTVSGDTFCLADPLPGEAG